MGVHDVSGRLSGSGTPAGNRTVSMSEPSSGTWKDASRFKMAPVAWRATTRRVQNDRPLRKRSTS